MATHTTSPWYYAVPAIAIGLGLRYFRRRSFGGTGAGGYGGGLGRGGRLGGGGPFGRGPNQPPPPVT